jgi:hypothetical protein
MFGSQMKFSKLMVLFGLGLASGLSYAQSADVVELEDGVSLEYSDEEYSGERVYVIQVGDTLWDIARQFWEDSDQWPRMWSYNSYITNPHWIYPGNVVSFTPGSLLDPPSMNLDGGDSAAPYTVSSVQFEGSPVECGPDVRYNGSRESAVFTTPGFISQADDIERMGEVYGAKSGMFNLSQGELVYLQVDHQFDAQCGDVFTTFRRGHRVRHPEESRLRYGYVYHVTSELRVIDVDGDMATAVVRRSFSGLQRGDMFGAFIPVAAELPVTPPRGQLEGVIVARLNGEQSILGSTGDTVFIDRGEADGVGAGDAFYVIHHADLFTGLRSNDENIPNQVAGRLIVTSVQEDHSTAVVVDAAAPIRVGDHISMSVE